MTTSEIQQKIEDIHVALSANPDPNTRQKLELGLEIFQSLLLTEQQKKSESQPTGKTEELGQQNERRLPTKAEFGAWAKGMGSEKEKEEARYHEFMEEQIQNENRVSVGRASETTVTIPVAEVKIGDTVRQLTQTEIVGYLKTYFKRVATGEKMKAGQYTAAYASEMGKTVSRLFDGWNLIYQETQEGSEWPPMVDIFPGWKNAQQAHKVTADILWRWASNRK